MSERLRVNGKREAGDQSPKAVGQLVAWVQGPAFSRGSAVGEARPSERGRDPRKSSLWWDVEVFLARERSQISGMKKKITRMHLEVHEHICTGQKTTVQVISQMPFTLIWGQSLSLTSIELSK